MLPKIIRRGLLKRKLRKLWEKSDLETVKSHIISDFQKKIAFRKCCSREDYLRKLRKKEAIEGIFEELVIEKQIEQILVAHCVFCGDILPMKLDFLYSGKGEDGKKIPNFRERLICPKCGMNNRLRATYHLIQELIPDFKHKKIYMTEELTYFFARLRERNLGVVGSEYFENNPSRKVYVKKVNREVNNENLTKLSFNDKSFDLIVSCDVLEHIPDYKNLCRKSIEY